MGIATPRSAQVAERLELPLIALCIEAFESHSQYARALCGCCASSRRRSLSAPNRPRAVEEPHAPTPSAPPDFSPPYHNRATGGTQQTAVERRQHIPEHLELRSIRRPLASQPEPDSAGRAACVLRAPRSSFRLHHLRPAVLTFGRRSQPGRSRSLQVRIEPGISWLTAYQSGREIFNDVKIAKTSSIFLIEASRRPSSAKNKAYCAP